MSTAHDPMHDPHADSPSAAHDITDAEHWHRLALSAEADLHERFGHRLMGIPGTWIGALRALPDQPLPKAGARPWSEWHYWWQAHYLDAIIDAAFSALQAGTAARHVRTGSALNSCCVASSSATSHASPITSTTIWPGYFSQRPG